MPNAVAARAWHRTALRLEAVPRDQPVRFLSAPWFAHAEPTALVVIRSISGSRPTKLLMMSAQLSHPSNIEAFELAGPFRPHVKTPTQVYTFRRQ
jgi:hypothetical protein